MEAARFQPVFIIWNAMTVITPPSPCAAVYIRVSTEDQAELSPETQLAEVEKYASREGITLLRDHIYIDAGISGKKAERRPEFMRMIAAAKEKGCPFQMILLWKYSRFARNQEESIFYKSILRSKCGVDVRSVTEPLIAGPFGSLIERIIEWMDEFYSIRLSQEVKRSMSVNAQRGKLQCAAPFGYRVEDGGLVPQTPEDRLVRRAGVGRLCRSQGGAGQTGGPPPPGGRRAESQAGDGGSDASAHHCRRSGDHARARSLQGAKA